MQPIRITGNWRKELFGHRAYVTAGQHAREIAPCHWSLTLVNQTTPFSPPQWSRLVEKASVCLVCAVEPGAVTDELSKIEEKGTRATLPCTKKTCFLKAKAPSCHRMVKLGKSKVF